MTWGDNTYFGEEYEDVEVEPSPMYKVTCNNIPNVMAKIDTYLEYLTKYQSFNFLTKEVLMYIREEYLRNYD